MNAAARLGLYAAALVLVFCAAFAIAGVAVPDRVVTNWKQQSRHVTEPVEQSPMTTPMH